MNNFFLTRSSHTCLIAIYCSSNHSKSAIGADTALFSQWKPLQGVWEYQHWYNLSDLSMFYSEKSLRTQSAPVWNHIDLSIMMLCELGILEWNLIVYTWSPVNPLTAGAAYIRVLIFYKHIKYHLLNMLKCDKNVTSISNIWKQLTSILSNLNNFRSLEVVSRWRDPQLQVGENSDWIIWRLKG